MPGAQDRSVTGLHQRGSGHDNHEVNLGGLDDSRRVPTTRPNTGRGHMCSVPKSAAKPKSGTLLAPRAGSSLVCRSVAAGRARVVPASAPS